MMTMVPILFLIFLTGLSSACKKCRCPSTSTCQVGGRYCPRGFPIFCGRGEGCCPPDNVCIGNHKCCPSSFPLPCGNNRCCKRTRNGRMARSVTMIPSAEMEKGESMLSLSNMFLQNNGNNDEDTNDGK